MRHLLPAAALAAALVASAGCRTGLAEDSALRDDTQPGPPPPAEPAELKPKEIFERSAKLFGDGVNEIHIYMKGSTFKKVVTHKDQGGDACKDDARYGHVGKILVKIAATGEEVELKDVGMRVRGNTSCGNYRKQYRIKLNADADLVKGPDGEVLARISRVFAGNGDDVVYSAEDAKRVDGQTLFGLKSFSLRTSQNDPTSLREKVASDVFAYGEQLARQKGLPGAAERGGAVYRVGFARLFVHLDGQRQDFGLYDVTEQIDKTMFRTRWGKAVRHAFQANLGKATLKAPLPASRDDLFIAYEPDQIDGKGFPGGQEYAALERLVAEGALPEAEAQASRKLRARAEAVLRELADKIAAATTRADLEAFLDVESVLSYLAAANLTGHWDSLVGNGNNDWLIFNETVGRWQLVVWDLDNTFGSLATAGGAFNGVWNARYDEFRRGGTDLLTPGERPLFAKVVKLYPEEYAQRVRDFIDGGAYDLHGLNDRLVALRNVFTGGHSDDPIWETLFTFKNHRWAHATCGLTEGKTADIGGDGRPRFVDYGARKPKCK